jgi:hypothetical protein
MIRLLTILFCGCFLWVFTASASMVKDQAPCVRQDCHGLNITCEIATGPRMCSAIYSIEDLCQSLAACEMIDGQCTLKKDENFDTCVECVSRCEKELAANRSGGYEQIQKCEMECRSLIGMVQQPPQGGTSPQIGIDGVPGSGF